MKTINIFEEYGTNNYYDLIKNPDFLEWASNENESDPIIKLDKGLALVDLDWTIRKPKKKGETFINEPKEQELINGINWILRRLNEKGFSIYGVSNQGGIEAGHKTLRSTIQEMRYLLSLTPYLNKVYFAVNNQTCWIVTRSLPFLDSLPLIFNTPSRFQRLCGAFEDDKFEFGGFRKPNKGMIMMAIADWFNKYRLIARIQKQEQAKNNWWSINPLTRIDAYDVMRKGDFYNSYQSKYHIFMAGDRDNDRNASESAKVSFVNEKEFFKGNIPQHQ